MQKKPKLAMTSNADVNAALKRMRGINNGFQDWRIIETRMKDQRHGFLWLRRRRVYRYELYLRDATGRIIALRPAHASLSYTAEEILLFADAYLLGKAHAGKFCGQQGLP